MCETSSTLEVRDYGLLRIETCGELVRLVKVDGILHPFRSDGSLIEHIINEVNKPEYGGSDLE